MMLQLDVDHTVSLKRDGTNTGPALAVTPLSTAARPTRRLDSLSLPSNPVPVTLNMRSWFGICYAVPCTTASVRSLRCSGTAAVDPPRPLRHIPGEYVGRSLYFAPSSFDGAQPGRPLSMEGPGKSVPGDSASDIRHPPSIAVKRRVVRLRPKFPTRRQASSTRNRRAIGELADHDAKECQGLLPPRKHRSDCYHVIAARACISWAAGNHMPGLPTFTGPSPFARITM
ncbi:hypothetical protein VTO73DRAFT_10363 [Trametes versicolor]